LMAFWRMIRCSTRINATRASSLMDTEANLPNG